MTTRYAHGNVKPDQPVDLGEKYMREVMTVRYRTNKLKLYLIYILFSANNLYGSMETLKLPVSNFKWVKKSEFKTWSKHDILGFSPQADVGYAFEVDLHYPSSLHKVSR